MVNIGSFVLSYPVSQETIGPMLKLILINESKTSWLLVIWSQCFLVLCLVRHCLPPFTETSFTVVIAMPCLSNQKWQRYKHDNNRSWSSLCDKEWYVLVCYEGRQSGTNVNRAITITQWLDLTQLVMQKRHDHERCIVGQRQGYVLLYMAAEHVILEINKFSHTFLIDNHVRLHSSQNASYTEDVCDMHLRLTAKPHLCVICSTFHT